MSADQGNDNAQLSLALIYFHGRGTPKNDEKAFELFLKSAEKGNPISQSNLAMCYEKGCGVKIDLDKAKYWSQKSGVPPQNCNIM
jgi:TPR repeat protein